MTQIDRATELAEPRYLLVKRDLYYAPNNQGYTGVKARAGRYHADDADPESGVTAIHEDDAPMFSKACWEDVKVNVLLARVKALEGALTASGDTKAAYLGEFKFDVEHLDEMEEPYWQPTTVPWDTIKEIMAAILASAALSQEPTK